MMRCSIIRDRVCSLVVFLVILWTLQVFSLDRVLGASPGGIPPLQRLEMDTPPLLHAPMEVPPAPLPASPGSFVPPSSQRISPRDVLASPAPVVAPPVVSSLPPAASSFPVATAPLSAATAPLPSATSLVPLPSGLVLPSQGLPSTAKVEIINPQETEGVAGTGLPGPQNQSGRQEALVTIEKILPPEVQVNRKEQIKIIVCNTGSVKIKDVILSDIVPAKTILVSTTPRITPGRGGELVWKGFELAPKEQREFLYEIIPQEEGEIGSIASLTYQAEISSRTLSTRPRLKVEVQTQKEVLIGEPISLDISITNVGTGTASGVVLVEKVPDGLKHVGGKVLDNHINTIAPQETKKLTLTLESVKPGLAINVLEVTAENGIVENVSTQIQVNSPELKLEIVGSNTRYLDREATYILKVSNPGTAAAHDVRISAELPKHVEFVRTNNLGEYDKQRHSVDWELVELPISIPPGELELVVKPIEAGTTRLALRGEGKQDLAAEVTHEIVIDGMPALSYEVKSLSDPVEVGKEALYEVQLANRGTKVSTNIHLRIQIPDEMKIIETDGPTQYRVMPGGVQFDRLDALGPKELVVYKIKAICSQPGDHRIRTQVSSDDMELLVKEESTRVYH